MKPRHLVAVPVVALIVAATSLAAEIKPNTVLPPLHNRLLVQSELDLLPAVKRPVTINTESATPAAFIEALRARTGLKIEIEGVLPATPTLSGSFRDAEAKAVLEWLSRQLGIAYRAEPPNTLCIVVDTPPARPAPPRPS